MTHILGEHAQTVITTARECRPNTHTPAQAAALLEAVLHCIDLAGGTNQASPPRFDTSPDKPVLANRTRTRTLQSAPMNPVNHHHSAGASQRPPGDMDSGYWRNQYNRVTDHHDRCEVVRRAATYLNSLIRRDPNATAGNHTDKYIAEDVLIEGKGWPLVDVARRFRLREREVVVIRIDDGRHPLTGKHWTPPTHNTFAAAAAREMRAIGMNVVDIARALNRNVNTVQAWTKSHRQAA